jgi:hypothetical protein
VQNFVTDPLIVLKNMSTGDKHRDALKMGQLSSKLSVLIIH